MKQSNRNTFLWIKFNYHTISVHLLIIRLLFDMVWINDSIRLNSIKFANQKVQFLPGLLVSSIMGLSACIIKQHY